MSIEQVIELSHFTLKDYFLHLGGYWWMYLLGFLLSGIVIGTIMIVPDIHLENRKPIEDYEPYIVGFILGFLIVGIISYGVSSSEHYIYWEENTLTPYMENLEVHKVPLNELAYDNDNDIYHAKFDFKGKTYETTKLKIVYDMIEYKDSYVEYKELSEDINEKYIKDTPYNIVLHTNR